MSNGWEAVKTDMTPPQRRWISPDRARMGLRSSLLAGALMLAAACAAPPPAANDAAGLSLAPLRAAGDCDKVAVRAPQPGELDEGALRELAARCLARSQELDISQLASAAAAHNAAQAHAELARRTGAAAEYAAADSAASQSRDKVNDINAMSNGGAAARRLVYSRMAIQVASRLERGLSDVPADARSCDGQQACIDSGLALAARNEDVLQIAAASADPALRDDHSRLQILRARGEAALASGEGYGGDIDRALSLLEGVIARERATSTATSQTRLAEARAALTGIATAEASQLLAGDPSPAEIQRAVGYLERGARHAEGDGAPALKVRVGETYAGLASARDETVGEAVRAGDLCRAAAAFDSALDERPALSVPDRVSALAGRGAALAGLADLPQQTCRADIGTVSDNRALADLDEAWSLASGEHVSVDEAVAYAGLLLDEPMRDGDRERAREVLSRFQSAGGEPAMRMNLLLAKEATSEVEALQYFEWAAEAYPPSPKPELERAKYLLGLGETGRTGAIEAALSRAIGDAAGDPEYAALEAEANYYRSLIAATPGDAIRWAERAVRGDSRHACYEYQACRAHLMAKQKEFGAGAGLCSANPRTPAGALFNALGELRAAQIERRKNPGFLSAFRPAEDAFRDAASLIGDAGEASGTDAPACPELDARLGFPGNGEDRLSDYERAALFGMSFARGCGTRVDEAVPALAPELRAYGDTFAQLGFTGCSGAG